MLYNVIKTIVKRLLLYFFCNRNYPIIIIVFKNEIELLL